MVSSLEALAYKTPTVKLSFYNTWEQMLDLNPVAQAVDCYVTPKTDCQLEIKTRDKKVNEMIKNSYLAASLNDTIWFINANYLKHDFTGEAKRMNDYIPLYFNEKTAYVIYINKVTFKDMLMGNDLDGYTNHTIDNYYIDFRKRTVERVTPKYLSHLLEDYQDLLMRYEGMKNYKKPEIIEDYFFKYIDRYTEDLMTPLIVDLVGNTWGVD